MSKQNKKPPEIEITVTVKFDEKIKYRQQVINLAAEEADADVTFKCMKDRDEITFVRNMADFKHLSTISEAMEDIVILLFRLLETQHLFSPKNEA